jgi:hypothetical protein
MKSIGLSVTAVLFLRAYSTIDNARNVGAARIVTSAGAVTHGRLAAEVGSIV